MSAASAKAEKCAVRSVGSCLDTYPKQDHGMLEALRRAVIRDPIMRAM
jgi:hypothetical protein